MSKNTNQEFDCPWCGRGASKEITGCRFSLSPMSDDYEGIILNAVKQVNTAKVWSSTDHLSTIYRGKRIHVVDTARACFTYAYQEGVHMVMEATFSKGCPGDTDADCYLAEDDIKANAVNLTRHFTADCKIAFYPLGISDYMRHIAYVVNLAISRGLYVESAHYVSILEGDVKVLFDFFDEILSYAEQNISHYVLEATLSVNSPSKKREAELLI